MNYKIDVLPGEPIILYTMLEQYTLSQDMPNADTETQAILNGSSEPMFLIVDVTRLSLSLNDVIQGATQAARGEQPLFHHPNVREVVVVATSGIAKLASKGLNTATFGNVNISVSGTVDEALAYVRSRMVS